jgi:hypothetical protein
MRDSAPEKSFYKISDNGNGMYTLFCREWNDSRTWTLLAESLPYEDLLVKMEADIEYRNHLKAMNNLSRYFDKRGSPL